MNVSMNLRMKRTGVRNRVRMSIASVVSGEGRYEDEFRVSWKIFDGEGIVLC